MNTLPSPNHFSATSAVPVAGTAIEIVSDLAGFDRLRGRWDDLFERSGRPQQVFQRFEFLRIWARHYVADASRPHIIVMTANNRVQAIVPLVRQRRFGMDTLKFMGAPVAQFDDALIEDGLPRAWLDALWQAIATSGADCLEARRVREDASLRGLLPDDAVRLEALQAPFALLLDRVGGDGPGRAYSARDRSNHRRRLRRLAELGDVVAGAQSPGESAARLAATAVDMKRAWLDTQGLPSPTVRDPRFRAFFVEAATAASLMNVSTIAFGGRPIAIDLSFDCKGHSFGHVIATEPAFEREGVGQLLIHHVFAMAKARGSTTFDLMTPLDDYKLRHADGVTDVASFVVPLTARGRLLAPVLFRHALPAAKAMARRLPARLLSRLLSRLLG